MVEIGTYNLNKMFYLFFHTIFPLPLMKSIYYTSTDLTIYITYNVQHQLCILSVNSLSPRFPHFHFRNLEFRKLPLFTLSPHSVVPPPETSIKVNEHGIYTRPPSFSFSRPKVSELINSLKSPCKPFISICLSGLTTKDWLQLSVSLVLQMSYASVDVDN